MRVGSATSGAGAGKAAERSSAEGSTSSRGFAATLAAAGPKANAGPPAGGPDGSGPEPGLDEGLDGAAEAAAAGASAGLGLGLGLPVGQPRSPPPSAGQDAGGGAGPDGAGPGSAKRKDGHHDDSPLDAATRQAAQLSAPALLSSGSPAAATEVQIRAGASLEEVLPALVKHVAWSGDGRRGTMRLELGKGELSGATLIVHADDGRVRVELSTPPGVDGHSWRDRILERLSLRGVSVDEVRVD